MTTLSCLRRARPSRFGQWFLPLRLVTFVVSLPIYISFRAALTWKQTRSNYHCFLHPGVSSLGYRVSDVHRGYGTIRERLLDGGENERRLYPVCPEKTSVTGKDPSLAEGRRFWTTKRLE